MSELTPRTAKPGDWYRTALGLRLLPTGSVIRNGPKLRPTCFRKIGADAWAYCDSAGVLRSSAAHGDIGTRRLPFRSEQIWLPAMLERIGGLLEVAATAGGNSE